VCGIDAWRRGGIKASSGGSGKLCEVVEASGGSRKLWRRSKALEPAGALEEVEGPEGG
jgi:hypothetical protein